MAAKLRIFFDICKVFGRKSFGKVDFFLFSFIFLFSRFALFLCSVSLIYVLCALSPLARFPSFVNCPAWYAGVTKTSQPRANRIPLLYPCYTRSVLPLKREKRPPPKRDKKRITGRLHRPLFLSLYRILSDICL